MKKCDFLATNNGYGYSYCTHRNNLDVEGQGKKKHKKCLAELCPLNKKEPSLTNSNSKN
jgi:hypothetical protein